MRGKFSKIKKKTEIHITKFRKNIFQHNNVSTRLWRLERRKFSIPLFKYDVMKNYLEKEKKNHQNFHEKLST
jgi:hypothetical protein